MIQAKPLARDLFVAWTRQNDPDALKKYFFTTGNPAAAAEVLVKESYQVRPLLWGQASCPLTLHFVMTGMPFQIRTRS
jgi:hypothetical protein